MMGEGRLADSAWKAAIYDHFWDTVTRVVTVYFARKSESRIAYCTVNPQATNKLL